MTTLEIGNLPASTTGTALLALFAEFNPISATVQIRDAGHGPQVLGCVTIPDIFQAFAAIVTLNGKHTPGSAPLSVTIKN